MRRLAGLLLLLAAGCDKPSPDGAHPVASVSVAASAAAAASSVPGSASATVAPKGPAMAASWRGTYKSAASTLTASAEGTKPRWSDSQPTAGLGEGTLALTVDGPTGHITGTVDGPLGPAVLDGAVTDGKLAATLRRKDPSDQGFAGTMLGSVASDHVEGTMNVSLGLAGALRTATFTLSPAGAAP